ncbi:MAG: PAS domain-containing protein, partial [Pyrinomonadaceae bacterium]
MSIFFLSYKLWRLAAVCAALVLLLGLANLLQMAANLNLGIDTLLMFEREWGRGGTISPGRFGAPATISFVFLGISLVTLCLSNKNHEDKDDNDESHRARVAAVTLAWATLTISTLSLMSHLYGASILHTIPLVTVIAMQTATCFLALSLSIILKNQDLGLVKLICNDGPAGMLIRRFVPVVIVVPIILGWLKLVSWEAGLFDIPFGTTARTIIEIGLMIFLLWWTGLSISRYAREADDRGRQLLESEERFRMASDAARALVYDTDLTGSRPLIVNGLRRVTGYSSTGADLSSKWWHSLIHHEDIAEHQKTLDDVIPFQHTFRSTYRIRHKDGHWVWVEDTARIIRDDTGEAVQMIGTIVDVTAQRLVESELEAKISARTAALTNAYDQLKREIRDRLHSEKQRFGLLKRLVSVQEDERGRIARDIHDQLGQRLTALRLKLASLRNLVGGNNEIAGRVDRLQTISELLDGEVSFLAWELRPAILHDAEFLPAIEQYVGEWSRFVEINAEFHKLGLDMTPIDGEIATNLYRITQEALNNVAKYSNASLVNVIIKKRGDDLILIIEDDGVGFDAAAAIARADERRGYGLFGMRERASLILGTFHIESVIRKGTTIFVKVPL